jgi:5-methyltetrahydrofolate--homocysteine methyltransferase
VDIILTNNGYKVINLGIKQPVENIINAYKEHNADCIAMSGLLVKSTAFMKENLQTFSEQGITVPVILGGAALTRKFVYEDCQRAYKGKVIYGKDAFADLHFMDKLMPAKAEAHWDDEKGFLDEAGNPIDFIQDDEVVEEPIAEPIITEPTEEDTARSEAIDPNIDRPAPPFWGTQILNPTDIPWEELFWNLDLQALIAGQWQFRKPREQTREEYDAFLEEKVYPVLARWKDRILNENLLHPQVVYGYFPCQAEGNSLHVYEPEGNRTQPFVTWQFPRQKSMRRYCIADFFATKESGQMDVLPMQAVTMGQVASEVAQELFKANNYTEYLYFHGMAVQLAEALAEWTHTRIRQELGFGDQDPDNIRDILAQRYQGSRYSFGYPACPNVHDQFKQLELLKTDRINLYMDESEQIYPEQSTTAFVAYHPAAKYFSA